MPSLSRRPNRSSRQFGTPRGQGLIVVEFPERDVLALRIEIGRGRAARSGGRCRSRKGMDNPLDVEQVIVADVIGRRVATEGAAPQRERGD